MSEHDEPTARDAERLADLIHVLQSRASIARHILTSDWLTERDERMRREGAAEALESAAQAIGPGWQGADRWLRRRGAAIRDGEST